MKSQIKRTIAVFLGVFFLVSITVAVPNATQAQYDNGYSKGKIAGESDAAANIPAKTKFNFNPSNSQDFNKGYIDGYNFGYYGGQISQQQQISQQAPSSQQTNTPASSNLQQIQQAGVGDPSREGGIAGASKGCSDGKLDKGAGKFLKTPAEGGHYAPRAVDPLYPKEYKDAYLKSYTKYYEECYMNP